ncbi:hypothetical protein ACFLYU_04400 [Candidatus Dependentiae bacterium]
MKKQISFFLVMSLIFQPLNLFCMKTKKPKIKKTDKGIKYCLKKIYSFNKDKSKSYKKNLKILKKHFSEYQFKNNIIDLFTGDGVSRPSLLNTDKIDTILYGDEKESINCMQSIIQTDKRRTRIEKKDQLYTIAGLAIFTVVIMVIFGSLLWK